MPGKYYTSKKKKSAPPADSLSAKNTNAGGAPQKSVLNPTATETALQARDRGVPFGPTPTNPTTQTSTPGAGGNAKSSQRPVSTPALLGLQNNPFIDTTGRPSEANAPYGLMKDKRPDGTTFWRPATQDESGSASIITADDLTMITPGGGFGAGLSEKAVLGFAGREADVALTSGVSKLLTKAGTLPEVGGITVKTKALIDKLIMREVVLPNGEVQKVISTNKLGKWAMATFSTLLAAVGTYTFGVFQQQEALDRANGVVRLASDAARDMAIQAVDYKQYQEAVVVRDALLNANINPFFIGGLQGTQLNFQAAKDTARISDKVMQDKAAAVQAGLDVNSQRQKAQDEQAAEQKASIDYYNQERARYDQMKMEAQRAFNDEQNQSRIETENVILAARAKSSASERAARKRQMEEEARFWEDQKKKSYELEAEERERQAAFWLEYKKMVLLLEQKARESQGSSTLHFGLLR